MSTFPLFADIEFTNLDSIEWQDGGGYFPHDTSGVFYQFKAKVNNTSHHDEDVFVTISKGNNNDAAYDRQAFSAETGESLSYQIYSNKSEDTSKIIKEVPDLNSKDNVIEERVKKNKSKDIKAFFYIPPEQIVEAGNYNDSLTFNLYLGKYTQNPNPSNLLETKTIPFNVLVPSILYLNAAVGDVGNQMIVDLGEISSGIVANFSVYVIATSGYEITAQSENNQTLVHENEIQSVSYLLDVDGHSVDLSAGNAVVVYTKNKKTKGQEVDFEIEVGSFDILAAGVYSDTIYVTLTED